MQGNLLQGDNQYTTPLMHNRVTQNYGENGMSNISNILQVPQHLSQERYLAIKHTKGPFDTLAYRAL